MNLSTTIKCAESKPVMIVVLTTGPRSMRANASATTTQTTIVIRAYRRSCGIEEDELSESWTTKYEITVKGAIVKEA